MRRLVFCLLAVAQTSLALPIPPARTAVHWKNAQTACADLIATSVEETGRAVEQFWRIRASEDLLQAWQRNYAVENPWTDWLPFEALKRAAGPLHGMRLEFIRTLQRHFAAKSRLWVRAYAAAHDLEDVLSVALEDIAIVFSRVTMRGDAADSPIRHTNPRLVKGLRSFSPEFEGWSPELHTEALLPAIHSYFRKQLETPGRDPAYAATLGNLTVGQERDYQALLEELGIDFPEAYRVVLQHGDTVYYSCCQNSFSCPGCPWMTPKENSMNHAHNPRILSQWHRERAIVPTDRPHALSVEVIQSLRGP